jgi:hypothetical protein
LHLRPGGKLLARPKARHPQAGKGFELVSARGLVAGRAKGGTLAVPTPAPDQPQPPGRRGPPAKGTLVVELREEGASPGSPGLEPRGRGRGTALGERWGPADGRRVEGEGGKGVNARGALPMVGKALGGLTGVDLPCPRPRLRGGLAVGSPRMRQAVLGKHAGERRHPGQGGHRQAAQCAPEGWGPTQPLACLWGRPRFQHWAHGHLFPHRGLRLRSRLMSRTRSPCNRRRTASHRKACAAG